VIVGVYVALRIATFAGVGVTRFPDSQSWLDLDFAGEGIRLWTVPLMFKVLPSDTLREIGQAALSALCWIGLATVVARTIEHHRLKPIAFGVVLVPSLVPLVTNWDSVILGESIGASLTVGLIAAWWAFVQWPTRATTVVVSIVSMLWAFCRHVDVVMTIPIFVIVLISLFVARRDRGRRLAVLIVLAVTLAWGLPTLGKNPFNEDEVLITIVSERILTSPERTAWFADHGMPHGHDVRALAGSFYTKGLGSTPIRKNHRLFSWIQRDGRSTYFEFLLTHPDFVLLEPAKAAIGPYDSALSSTVYGTIRTVLPGPVNDISFGGPGELIFLGVIVTTLALLAFGRRRWTMRELVPGSAVVLSVVLYVVTFHGVASEPPRHYFVSAVAVRVSLLVLGLMATDRLLTRSARPRGSPGTRTSSATRQATPARRGGATGPRSRAAR
jgi:hypothetical protein